MSQVRIAAQTRNNWLIDAAVFLGGLLAALSGIYFLFLPSGGYRGGRNPAHDLQILFERHTWSDLHTVAGLAMVAAVAVHLAIHWRWVKMMVRRVWTAMAGGEASMSRPARLNLVLDAVVAVTFALCALSGIYFLFVPGGEGAAAPGLLFSPTAWDLIHTWSGVLLIVASMVHLAIHWRWVKNVSKRLFLSLLPRPRILAPGNELSSSQP